jgi:hypothetical protein
VDRGRRRFGGIGAREAEDASGTTARNDEEQNARNDAADKKAAEKHEPMLQRKQRQEQCDHGENDENAG